MLSKNQIKHIRQLHQGKFREIHRQYIVEGEKMLNELLKSEQNILHIYALESWLTQHEVYLKKHNIAYTAISENELKQISGLVSPYQVLALVAHRTFHFSAFQQGIYIALDQIQDPGNMGTIIRSAEWFGVKGIFCSEDCVEVYNSKVVQSSMGSVFRVPVYYLPLAAFLKQHQSINTYAAVLHGDDVYNKSFNDTSIIVIGNESKGISNPILSLCKHKITIPNFGEAESLNAAVSCSIILALSKK
jgi:RNA methyltransferase, TrmH family